MKKFVDDIIKGAGGIPPVDRSQRTTTGGMDPADPSHKELKPNGQQRDYVILSDEERARGFVRPVRRNYVHVGPLGPQYPLRDLTEEEKKQYSEFGYIKYEAYPPDKGPTGCYWTQARLDKIGKGCGTRTTMSLEIAETYARDPHFYGGTFCCGCGKHLPVGPAGEFVWDGTDERVGM